VPEPVAGALELDGNELLTGGRAVEPAAVPQDVVHHRLPDELRQELVQDDPLVVPANELPGGGEDAARLAL
jgi:hypothetical protein